jgi:hypothetical protein
MTNVQELDPEPELKPEPKQIFRYCSATLLLKRNMYKYVINDELDRFEEKFAKLNRFLVKKVRSESETIIPDPNSLKSSGSTTLLENT